MKKLLLASSALLMFSLSILIIQSSCSKSRAQTTPTPTNITQLGKIIYARNLLSSNAEIWTSNFDGTNAVQIPLTFPSNIKIDANASYFSLKISPDGQTIFFSGYDPTSATYTPTIYSCSITGANLSEVIPVANGTARLGQAY